MRMHEIGGEELIQIIDRAKPNASEIDTIAAVLGSCFEEVVEPGPYAFLSPGPGKPAFGRLLQGDVLVAILRLRIASFPRLQGAYEFDFPCSYPLCGDLTPWSVDLGAMLAHPKLYRSLSPDSFMRVAEGTPFPFTTSSGTTIHFQLSTPSLLKPVRDLMKRENRKKLTDVELVAQQLVSVEGLRSAKTNEPIKDLRGLWQWARKQTAGTLDEILAAYEAADCGIDTEIRVRCETCGRQQDRDLPFGRTFFAPRSATKKGSMERPSSGEDSSPDSTRTPGEPSCEPSAGTPTEAAATTSPRTTSSE